MESQRLCHELGYSVPPFQKKLFSVLGQFVGVVGDATRLLERPQTCSIGFMSGEHAGHSIRTIPSRKGILHEVSTMWPAVMVH
ncbi:hypothetical protein TNCV_892331 [Trichonephila clavipes]|nr:hypothetical protein TNCV_892331 [Trichonephila clavipes]